MYKDYDIVHESNVINMFFVQISIAVFVIIVAVLLYSLAKVFKKSSVKERYAYIPFYNIYELLGICGVSKVHLILLFVPIVNLYSWYLISASLSECFNKNKNFTYLMFFLPFIGIPILGLTKEKFVGINNKRVNGIFIEELKKVEVETVEKSEVLHRNTQIGMGQSTSPNLNMNNEQKIQPAGELKADLNILNQNKKQEEFVECPNCHNKVKESADTCFYCGYKIKANS